MSKTIAHVSSNTYRPDIDGLRALAIIFVVIYHAFPTVVTGGFVGVDIFFVISGFCIHYPNSHSLRIPSILEYFPRRYLRIGIPLIVAVMLSTLTGENLSLFHDSILWSLLAELIYYTIYPFLLTWRRNGMEWKWVFAGSFAAALTLVVAVDPHVGNYASYGVYCNWILGLPCWILGCMLAERVSLNKPPLLRGVWRWRFFVWGLSVFFRIIRFHSPIGYPWTLNVFAIFVFFWLENEIAHYHAAKPSRFLEWAGKWSYSSYLIHLMGSQAYVYTLYRLHLSGFGSLDWPVAILFTLSVCYLFYLTIELPGHYLARFIGKSLQRQRVD